MNALFLIFSTKSWQPSLSTINVGTLCFCKPQICHFCMFHFYSKCDNMFNITCIWPNFFIGRWKGGWWLDTLVRDCHCHVILATIETFSSCLFCTKRGYFERDVWNVMTKPGILRCIFKVFILPKPNQALTTALSQQKIENWKIKFQDNPWFDETYSTNIYSGNWIRS